MSGCDEWAPAPGWPSAPGWASACESPVKKGQQLQDILDLLKQVEKKEEARFKPSQRESSAAGGGNCAPDVTSTWLARIIEILYHIEVEPEVQIELGKELAETIHKMLEARGKEMAHVILAHFFICEQGWADNFWAGLRVVKVTEAAEEVVQRMKELHYAQEEGNKIAFPYLMSGTKAPVADLSKQETALKNAIEALMECFSIRMEAA